jgi:hypothetical protein
MRSRREINLPGRLAPIVSCLMRRHQGGLEVHFAGGLAAQRRSSSSCLRSDG